MKLQGRNLSASMQGPDVALLQRELRKLDFKIPPVEFQANSFGDFTEKAVREFQTAHKLAVSGVVNEHTATAINAAVDAPKPAPELPDPIPTPAPKPRRTPVLPPRQAPEPRPVPPPSVAPGVFNCA